MARTLFRSIALLAAAAAAAHAITTRPSASEKLLRAAGVMLMTGGGKVELLDPRNPDYLTPSIPLPLGVGMEIRTGMLSKAGLQLEDGSSVTLGSHSQVKIPGPVPELREGRVQAVAAPRMRVTIHTSAVPVVVRGGFFSIEIPGKGRGRMAALGNGRAPAGKVIAAKGLVEVQLPFGTVRPTELPLTLHEGSVVNTQANSFAVIEFKDGARVKVRADSTAAVENEKKVTVAAGAVDVYIPQKSELEVRTSDREADIRGAAFSVEVAPKDQPSNRRLAEEPIIPPKRASAEPAPPAEVPGSQGWDGGGSGGR